MQDRALAYLDMMAFVEQERSRVDHIKGLLGSSDFDRVKHLFPEYFAPDDPYEQATDPETGEIDIDQIDDAALDWGVATPDQDEEMERWINERSQGTVTAAEINDEWL